MDTDFLVPSYLVPEERDAYLRSIPTARRYLLEKGVLIQGVHQPNDAVTVHRFLMELLVNTKIRLLVRHANKEALQPILEHGSVLMRASGWTCRPYQLAYSVVASSVLINKEKGNA